MKIIGDKSLFAYQWELVDHGKNDYWGNFCFWIGDVQVGIYEEFTTLSISLSYLKDFLKESGNRIYFRSEIIPKDELFYDVYEKYFDDDYKGNTSASYGYFRDVFWLDKVGEDSIRDKIGLILLNEPIENRQRFIWKSYKTNQIEEAFIPTNYFEFVSRQFIEALSVEIDSME